VNKKRNTAVGPHIRSNQPADNIFYAGIVIFSLYAGLTAATQYFAYTFQYQAILGAHLHHIYLPWSILVWALKWHTQYADPLMIAGSMGMGITTIGMLGVTIAKIMQTNSAKSNPFLHGSACWANREDIEASGLLNNVGVYIGAWFDEKSGLFHYLRHNGPEHILTYAPTRSGKGVGLVIPTLLSWPHSALITDLKGELWALTAGWRKAYANNKVLRFEPAAPHGSVRWNPLDEIRLGTEHEVGDVQNLATLIVDPDGRGMESHWQKTSQALLVGLILHALFKRKKEGYAANLPAIDAMLADPKKSIDTLWKEMISYKHIAGEGANPEGKNHPVVGAAARDMIDRPAEESGSVLSTAKSYLSLYRDQVVAGNVSRSDFKIEDLMNHHHPMSLYIVTRPNDKARLRPLVRILVNMSMRLLADKMDFENGRPKVHYKHRLLMMLDEFPSLGKLEIMQESLAFVAGYGIKCYIICQDINQLKSRETGYGPNETITSNCHIQNAYPPNRIETAEHLSKLTGQTTIIKEQITTSGRRMSTFLNQVSRVFQEVQRPLLTVDECLRMPGPKKNADGNIEAPGDMVIYAAGYPAIYGKQPLYFKDPVFQKRAEIPAPKISDVLTFLGDIKLDQEISI